MDLLKKHYEKILLSLVLLVLAGTAVWLFMAIDKKRTEISVTIPPLDKGKPIAKLELSSYQKALDRLKTPPEVNFGLPHHLFNPVVWKQSSDGKLIKFTTVDAPRVTNIRPLYTTITFEKATDTGAFQFSMVREAMGKKANQSKALLKEGDKGQFFRLKKIEGTPEKPGSFVLELNDSKQDAVVKPDEPYKRLDGYAADMKYDIEKKEFPNLRMGENVTFGGEMYKIVAITANAVTVQANSNQKQTVIKWKTAP